MDTSAQSHSYDIIFVIGPPGSGKGTLCSLTVDGLYESGDGNYYHLSVGDYLRELCETGRPGPRISIVRKHLLKDELLPAKTIIRLLDDKIDETINGDDTAIAILVDGFPRNIETALAFEEQIAKPAKVIVLECTRDTAQSRYLKRGREKSDNEERFKRRYDEYVENMKAIREHYGNNIQTICVDGVLEGYIGKFISAVRKPK
ncbi:P-loop containing nucleoside triphosphate hydrolase protein [Annulohypoxylon moriforme]|nr:P-loop containing nucleoside triphosphate hydrolase protein [Annulohypoxylon moriforme]